MFKDLLLEMIQSYHGVFSIPKRGSAIYVWRWIELGPCHKLDCRCDVPHVSRCDVFNYLGKCIAATVGQLPGLSLFIEIKANIWIWRVGERKLDRAKILQDFFILKTLLFHMIYKILFMLLLGMCEIKYARNFSYFEVGENKSAWKFPIFT